MSVFREAPFGLALNDLIEIQVFATNGKGTSDPSHLNTEGGIVQNVP